MALVDTSTIADTKTIVQLLTEASASRCLLQVEFEAKPEEQPVVRLLEADEQSGILVEPLKAEEADAILSAVDLSVSFVFKAKKYMFITRAIGVATEGLAGVRLAFPITLKKIELRSYYRVRLGDEDIVMVQLSSGDFPDTPPDTPIEGKVLDISEGGLSCEISSLPEGVASGAWVGNLQITLRRGYILSTSGTIKRRAKSKSEAGEKVWICGIEFAPLERADHNALVEFIFEKQREEIKRMKHLLG